MDAQRTPDMQKMQEIIAGYAAVEKRMKLVRFAVLNRYARPGQIVLAGSSLMEQFPIAELLTSHDETLTVYNRGVGGFVCAELADALDICILALRPARLFLNIGTNDLNDPSCDDEALTARYRAIVQRVQAALPDTEINLLSYYPVNPDAAENPWMAELCKVRTNARIRSANTAVQSMAAACGVRFHDVNAGLYDEDGRLRAAFTTDGMHMNADGYNAVLELLLPILKQG